MLSHGGRLAFLLPADVCEGVSSSSAWSRICERFRLEAVLTFSERAAPFPQVDTNAMVFFISNLPPKKSFTWLRVEARNPAQILASLRQSQTKSREIVEALATGLSRPPKPRADGVPLSSLARIVRGIATGANDFFFLTKQRLFELGLEQRWFIRAIGRTRDCRQPVLTGDVLEALDRTGRATWLLNLGSEPKDRLPKLLRDYLAEGEASGLPDRALISTRRPWYKMERREPPALLFAYLGRRDCRFILNRAAAVPLTGFLCVYPFDTSPDHVERLWRAVNHPDTVANLQFAAKSYGSGALKAEPRQLDKLLIPRDVLKEVGLNEPANEHATELFPTLLSAAV